MLADFGLAPAAKSAASNSCRHSAISSSWVFSPRRGDPKAAAEMADMWMVGVVSSLMSDDEYPIFEKGKLMRK